MVGIEKGSQVGAELSVRLVVISANGGLLKGAIHAFDLAIGPRMVGFGEAVVDGVTSAGVLKGMSAEGFSALESQSDIWSGGGGVAWGGEMSAVVGEDGMDAVREDGDQFIQKIGRSLAGGLFHQPNKGELGSAINGDERKLVAQDFMVIGRASSCERARVW